MKTIKIEIKWAVLFAIMMLLWMLMEKLLGLHDEHIDKHMVYTNFVAIPAILMYVFALLDKRKNFYNGVMTYGQAFTSGLIMSLIIAVLTPLTQYITSTVITPNYFANVIEYAVAEGMMTQTDAEAYFNLQNYIIQSTVFAPVMGIITTLLVGLFVRKKA